MSVSPYRHPDKNIVLNINKIEHYKQGEKMAGFEDLTLKEKQIFGQLMKGFSLSEIAIDNICSVKEIIECKDSIINKLDQKLMDDIVDNQYP